MVLIPKTAEKFLSDKDKEETCRDKNSYDFSYLINLKSKKKLKLFEKNLQISNEYYSEGPIENEEENKITRKEKIQNTMKRFSELTGGLDFLEIQEVEKLFQDGILKYTFYREIKAGDHFGDLGIIRDKPRSATIICKENCSFGILKSEEFKSIFAVVERKKFDEKIDFFKKHLIRKSNENDLVKFSYAFEKRKSTRNEILYKEGDIVKEVFFIKKGEVQVLKNKKIYIIFTVSYTN